MSHENLDDVVGSHEQIVTVRYNMRFEKKVPMVQQRNETRADMVERIADKLFYNQDEALDGRVLDIGDFEEM